ncbi:hypothetical protein U9M48_016433 [Paspalum notatum var. saurae]|uniref:Integrase catalytic domain-containing protein n=1 Tax=Paspalum notatum var. saurae TaxID=547442 RepID=A0AAQ3T7H6_PASNO
MDDRRCCIAGVSGDQQDNGGSMSATAVSGAAAADAAAATTGALQHCWPQLHPRAGLLGEYPGIIPQQQQQAIWHPIMDDGCSFGDHPQNTNNVDWYMDSGASDHVTMDAGNLSALGSCWLHDPTDSCIRVADGSRIPVVSAGSCHFPSATARGPLVLRDVLVAPRLVENLISVRRFTIDNNCSVEFDPYGYSIKDLLTQTLIARYDSPGEDRYLFPAAGAGAAQAQASTPTNAASNTNKLVATSHALITCNQSGGTELCCRACQCQQLEDAGPLNRFDLVHCAVCTSSVASAWGHKYTLFLVDDRSHFLWTFPLRLPADIFPTLSHFFGYVRARFGVCVRRVQYDGCPDLAQLSARLFFLSNGVELRAPCPCNASRRRPCSVGIIRGANAVAQSLLTKAGMSAVFWADALDTATYLINRHPTAETTLGGFYYTPYFALYGTHPSNAAHLRAFGCACYPDVSATAAASPRIQPPPLCVFLGYSEDRGYRCLDLASNRIVFSPSVAFVEPWFPLASSSSSVSNDPSRPPVSSKDFDLLLSANDNDVMGDRH